ncbi:Hypothetical_protein [Hexamita inflata]|uniref:Hypothetical_protein n=1 Tax=Hexamita inflata TaxID=28002 RepID=A0AA86PP67_9EUKA|nr:Hypothetical protein HINF_LOCUS28493 [Hexamita inflata]
MIRSEIEVLQRLPIQHYNLLYQAFDDRFDEYFIPSYAAALSSARSFPSALYSNFMWTIGTPRILAALTAWKQIIFARKTGISDAIVLDRRINRVKYAGALESDSCFYDSSCNKLFALKGNSYQQCPKQQVQIYQSRTFSRSSATKACSTSLVIHQRFQNIIKFLFTSEMTKNNDLP